MAQSRRKALTAGLALAFAAPAAALVRPAADAELIALCRELGEPTLAERIISDLAR